MYVITFLEAAFKAGLEATNSENRWIQGWSILGIESLNGQGKGRLTSPVEQVAMSAFLEKLREAALKVEMAGG